jgi:hypothetical protein
MMEARTIRWYGGAFYLSMSIVGVIILFILVAFPEMSFMEKTLYNLFIAGENIFLSVPIIIFYVLFLCYFNLMGVIYHELGHAVAMRHYGYDRIAIWINKFSGMTFACHGEHMIETEPLINDSQDAIADLFGGVLSGAILLFIYAITQSLGILIIFGALINYSAWETLEGDKWTVPIVPFENFFNGNGLFIMNELSELDRFYIEETMYVDNPT